MTREFRALLMEGLRRFAQGGYVSETALQDWLVRLQAALERDVPADSESRELLTRILENVYNREIGSGLQNKIPGVSRYTIDRVSPQLRAELDQRIFAGVELIRLNRRAAVEKTLQRFAGWVSSVPRAGTTETGLRDVASEILKPVARVKFESRRVAIDQGHKLSAAVAHVVSMGEGAIAGIWHDRGEHDRGYDARPEHLKRSGRLYLVRNSWAIQEGLVRPGPYTDEIEQPAFLPMCSCFYEYITTPQRLPKELLTGRGRAWVAGKRIEEYRTDACARV